MKTLEVAVPAAALCLFAAVAQADPQNAVVRVYSLDVQQRIQQLELIDVTAEKPAAAAPEEEKVRLERDVLDILAEVEALESAKTPDGR